jgi:hypothetical protein
MSTYDEWTDDVTPNKKGWYGVNYCWDVQEGSFCSAFYFDGDNFLWGGTPYPMMNISRKVFTNSDECDDWIEENDISF